MQYLFLSSNPTRCEQEVRLEYNSKGQYYAILHLPVTAQRDLCLLSVVPRCMVPTRGASEAQETELLPRTRLKYQ
jgi:hypothetical protein